MSRRKFENTAIDSEQLKDYISLALIHYRTTRTYHNATLVSSFITKDLGYKIFSNKETKKAFISLYRERAASFKPLKRNNYSFEPINNSPLLQLKAWINRVL